MTRFRIIVFSLFLTLAIASGVVFSLSETAPRQSLPELIPEVSKGEARERQKTSTGGSNSQLKELIPEAAKGQARDKAAEFPAEPWGYFTHCSCDSATYCLSDQDVIMINVYHASLKQHLY